MSKPIIIQIICHDLGRFCEPYHPEVRTPNLAALARDAVTFENAHCASPACSPSRGCLMTGCYPQKNSMLGLAHLGWSMDPAQRTLVDYFNEAGFYTAHFGHQHERTNIAENHYQLEARKTGEDDWCERAFEQAASFMRSWDAKSQGLYLNIGTIETHISRWGTMNADERQELYGTIPESEVFLPPHMPDAPVVREAFTHFHGCVGFLDQHFGRFVDGLKASGLYDACMLIFTTDHGISGLRAKGTLYDAGTETALMVKLPEQEGAGRRLEALTTNIDLGPTMLDFGGVPIAEEMDGRSNLPLLRGDPAFQPHDHVFTERNFHSNYDPMRSIRTRDFHYIANFGESPLWEWTTDEVPELKPAYQSYINEAWLPFRLHRPKAELYDLRADPHECRNVANKPAYESAQAGLHQQLVQWMEDRGDFLFTGGPPPPNDPARFPGPRAA